MRTTFAFATALLLSATSLAHAGNSDAEVYTYGTELDIASVLSIKLEPTPFCKVTNAVMTYRDSTDQVRKLSYRTLSESCKTEN
ncbi:MULTISPECIES: DUF2790 domain-containing protein [Pseudomonadaceae]|jgi:hypothetical protein|uniref:DUF2790 domain-containing protein n=1 Tax=Pseudomonadaceae TaxID=135621 RepID=UPI000F7B102F|nr:MULTISPECIES: DUF2790 domain-containing protein [Pseudomonadaceae]MBE7926274.1 DUF2790 domain-containing protein [Pseudomonas saudiphocaensis]MCF6780354.1 DUF2790 domain-containing protein [Stutzerimonas stutzeri]MCF6804709.1 DUF2790 domain-containing protein [Stutzerimonas stutzeri]RRV17286.1 DUF2790 domain-containing protein [Pseudomonas saudiphocaensis]